MGVERGSNTVKRNFSSRHQEQLGHRRHKIRGPVVNRAAPLDPEIVSLLNKRIQADTPPAAQFVHDIDEAMLAKLRGDHTSPRNLQRRRGGESVASRTGAAGAGRKRHRSSELASEYTQPQLQDEIGARKRKKNKHSAEAGGHTGRGSREEMRAVSSRARVESTWVQHGHRDTSPQRKRDRALRGASKPTKTYVQTFAQKVVAHRQAGDHRREDGTERRIAGASRAGEDCVELHELHKMANEDVFVAAGSEREGTSDYVDVFNWLIMLSLPLEERHRMHEFRKRRLLHNVDSFVDATNERATLLRATFERLSDMPHRSNRNSAGNDAMTHRSASLQLKDLLAKVSLFWGGRRLQELSESYHHDFVHGNQQALTAAHLWTVISELSTRALQDCTIDRNIRSNIIPDQSLSADRPPIALTQLQKLSVMQTCMASALNDLFEGTMVHEPTTEPGTLQNTLDRIVERSYCGLGEDTVALLFEK